MAETEAGAAELAGRVGRRLRELRSGRGLSLSELARRSGIGKGTLSELESGRRNPTLETLYALTTALSAPLSALLSPAGGRETVSGGAVDAVLTDRHEDASAVTEVFRIRIRAGSAQESAAHAPGTREHIVVLGGTARVGEAASPLTVGPGGHGAWAADVPHLYAAPDGDVEAVLVVRYAAAAPGG
ncbi:helix-turn-helix domain-containing protein [Streptomyces sp. AV19]|uniref:XRE family transcriptional regulator n=1 Tax=Streptomyces sp. AV19 TaxID=2793068 RepID=UPI0018FEF6BD|nr:XRE family transcriptional regulator [Streptomyces sp. AV19]MBH1938774.1 helix-turn-helix domain-containing protein [Streptomyces sp. AV19]MDG4533949.1 XRE family transcriptional regulator [Streptomyces sp. AV19]